MTPSPPATDAPQRSADTYDESWVLVGSVGSGKTFFLDTAMTSRAVERSVANPRTGIMNFDFIVQTGSDTAYVDQVLRTRAQGSVPDATSGEVRPHRFVVNLQPDPSGEVADSALPVAMHRKRILMIDGPGGALVRDRPKAELEGTGLEHTGRDLNEAVMNATALIMCIPAIPNDRATMEFEDGSLVELLSKIMLADAPKLKRIAVCLTKYDAPLYDLGPDAHRAARDRDTIATTWMNIESRRNIHEALRDIALSSTAENRVDVMFFPVSTYGFIGDTGYPNYEPRTDLPLVLPQHPLLRVGHFDVPLYPEPFKPSEVNKLVRPFNIAEPLAFLAGGSAKGMLHMSMDEMEARVRQAEEEAKR